MPRTKPWVKCQYCNYIASDQNISRHVRRQHAGQEYSRAMERGDPHPGQRESRDSSFPPVVAREFRRQVASEMSTSEQESTASNSSSMEYMRNEYVFAATRVLDQHHQFSEPQLLRFLEEEHPEIDPEHRFPLLIGAVSGAHFAAKLHVFANYNEHSRDSSKRDAANNARSALSNWNFGLRLGTCPALPVYTTGQSLLHSPDLTPDSNPPSGRRSATSTASAELQLVELHLPVSRERALEDFPSDPPSPQRSMKMITEPPPSSISLPMSAATATVTSSSAVRETVRAQHEPYVPPGANLASASVTYEPTAIVARAGENTRPPAASTDLPRDRPASMPAALHPRAAASVEAAASVSQMSSGESGDRHHTSTPARLSESDRYRQMRRANRSHLEEYRSQQHESRRQRSPTDRDPAGRDNTPRREHRRATPERRHF